MGFTELLWSLNVILENFNHFFKNFSSPSPLSGVHFHVFRPFGVSFWIVSKAVPSSTPMFFSVVSELLLVTSFRQLKNLYRFDLGPFIFSMAFLRLMLSSAFLNIWNIVIIKWLECFCLLIILSLSFLSWFELIGFLVFFPLIMGHVFLFLCIPGYIWFSASSVIFTLLYTGYFLFLYLFLSFVLRYS